MDKKKVKILAIDDNEDNLVVLKALIKDSFPNALYYSSVSGSKGIESAQAEKPDVILLALVMPVMDGCEVCAKLKSDLRLRHIPVVMVTENREDKDYRIKALEAGADAFLPKPFDESELRAQIRSMLRIKESEDQKKEEKQRLEDMVLDRTEALEIELADRKKAEKKLIISLDKITRNKQAILNLMSDLRTEMEERKLVDEKLQLERNLLRKLIDNIPDTIYILDKDGRKIIANKEELRNIRCKSEEEVLGKNDIELFPGEIGIRGHADNMFVINTKTPILDKEEYFFIDGMKHWRITSKYPLFDMSGNINGLLGTGRDITRRKETEEDINRKNKELTFLNKLATDLSAFGTEDDIAVFLVSRLKELTGSEFLVYSEFDPESKIFFTRHIDAEKSILSKLIKVAGDKILNNPAPIMITERSFNEIVTEIVTEKNTLNEASFGAIPKFIDKAFSSFSGISRYIGLSYVVSGEIYGTTLIGLKKAQDNPSFELLKSFAHIIAVSLQRRKAEATLKISEEKFRVLIQNQGEGVGIVDLNEKFVFANPAAEKMFGVEKDGLLSRDLMDFVKPEQKDIIKTETTKRINAEKSSYEIDIIRPNREQRTLLVTATPQFTKEGILSGTFGVFRDITERKQMEQKIIESEAYYRTLVDISPDGIIIANLEGNVSYGSKKAYEIFGVPPGEDVTGTSILRWLAPDSQNTIMERVMEIIRGNIAPETREFSLKKFDGTIFWGELSSSPLMDSSGNANALIIVCRDISDRKRAEAELIKSKEKAEESDRLKTAFLHNISHEIRTPMNAIIGFSSLLNEPGLDEDSKNLYIDTINQSSNHLLSIVSDIIEVSNIEAGIVKLNLRIVNLNSLLTTLSAQFLPGISEKGISLKCVPGLPDDQSFVNTDETKLIQVITCLLSNSLKFTFEGRIEFGYRTKKNNLEFFVSDTGIGIDAENHKRIFDRFYQVESSIHRQYEGTGLGLSIAKAYVELLGGKIWLTSEPGSGTTFFFTIQYSSTEPSLTEEKKSVFNEALKKYDNKTVLIAEDEENNYRLLVEFLSGLNLKIIQAVNGKEAIDICDSSDSIDLVLMDIKMPVMDGLEATTLIKKERPSLPVIAQTAFAFESDRDKVFKAGCDDYLSKPIKKDLLIAMVKKYL